MNDARANFCLSSSLLIRRQLTDVLYPPSLRFGALPRTRIVLVLSGFCDGRLTYSNGFRILASCLFIWYPFS